MKHTSLSAHDNCSLESSDWTVVYQNDEDISIAGWNVFTFQMPFLYDGSDNLLIDFSHNNTESQLGGYCMASQPGGIRSVCGYSDDASEDPLVWPDTTPPNLFCTDYVPNIKLTICPNWTIFEDTFDSTTLDVSKWPVVSGVTVDSEGINEPSAPYSLHLNENSSGADFIESKIIDLSDYNDAVLKYKYQCPGNGEPPDSSDDLVIKYFNGSEWLTLVRYFGRDPFINNYSHESLKLPSDALHPDFRLRIQRFWNLEGVYRNWFVDDLKIEIQAFHFNEDFEDGDLLPWESLNAGPSPGPYEITMFDVNGNGHESLAFQIALNKGTPDGIIREVILREGIAYNIALDIAEHNAAISPISGIDWIKILVNGQQVAGHSFFANPLIVYSGQTIEHKLEGIYTPTNDGTHTFSITFDSLWNENKGILAYIDDFKIWTDPRE